MRKKELSVAEAASQLTDIIEGHLEKLPEPERATRRRAFHKAVSNALGTPARRAKRSGTRATRLSALRSE